MPTSHASSSAAPALPYQGRLMFTQSWEDPACDLAALNPQPGESILAITSGADNILGFLLADPRRIVAVDLNPAQTHLFELKRAAFQQLTHGEMLVLLGARAGENPGQHYARVRSALSPQSQAFWDARTHWFARGLLTRGGFEQYYALLRTMLRLAIGRRRLERLFTLSPEEQPRFYAEQWNTLRWRLMIRLGCSKFMLGRRLDPSWFAHADVSSFGAHFARLGEHVVARIPARSNYFLAQILLGRYLDEATVPDYLRAENFELIRSRVDRITVVTADIADALKSTPPASIDCFALSNVFEYSPPETFARSIDPLGRAARPGARFALRNLLAPRRLAGHPQFVVDAGLGARLRDADRGFIYSHFEAARLAPTIP